MFMKYYVEECRNGLGEVKYRVYTTYGFLSLYRKYIDACSHLSYPRSVKDLAPYFYFEDFNSAINAINENFKRRAEVFSAKTRQQKSEFKTVKLSIQYRSCT